MYRCVLWFTVIFSDHTLQPKDGRFEYSGIRYRNDIYVLSDAAKDLHDWL